MTIKRKLAENYVNLKKQPNKKCINKKIVITKCGTWSLKNLLIWVFYRQLDKINYKSIQSKFLLTIKN